ncbi:MAG: hypothetical protein M3P12_13645 [Gemmatimonadota bacterium]|nr:hypothetical protein [Gemmatimonadota bacterium]
MMSVNRFYRLALWLPILIPAAVMIGASVVGLPTFEPLSSLVVALIASGLAGALPYSLFALWASWRIRGKSERDIRRLALRAPGLMVLVFIPVAFLMGASEGDALGGAFFILIYAVPCILVLGYGYVALVFWLRHLVRNREWISTPPATAA